MNKGEKRNRMCGREEEDEEEWDEEEEKEIELERDLQVWFFSLVTFILI